MAKPIACPAAPGPLEEYAVRVDDLFTHVAQRRGFREYLAGLLALRDRNKTLTALAGAESVTGPKLPAAQRLQFFLSESVWDPDLVNERRLELLLARPLTAPHGGGVLVIDESGDRKDASRRRCAVRSAGGSGASRLCPSSASTNTAALPGTLAESARCSLR
jgi:SRSO17 transposase